MYQPGTRIWKAAVLGLEYIIRLRLLQQQQQKQQRRLNQNKDNINSTKDARAASDINDNDDNYYKQYSSLLELGCGLVSFDVKIWTAMKNIENLFLL